MNYPRLITVFLFVFLIGSSFVVSANKKKAPFVASITQTSVDGGPIVEIYGKHFGHKPEKVQVMINESGSFAKVLYVSPQMVQAQLSNSQICAGQVSLRVLVDRKASNATTVEFAPGAPIIDGFDRNKVHPGSLIEIRGYNLSCDAGSNLVSFNDTTVKPMAINGNTLTVRIPEQLADGIVKVKVTINGLESGSLPLTIESAAVTPGGNNNSGGLRFTNSSGVLGAAGFAPLFSILDAPALTDGNVGMYWDANFYGMHQSIINVPWKTVTGDQQVALLTLNIGHSNSLAGNSTGEFEKFVYMRINYPLRPELPYDPVSNPFWWGASSISTEHAPHGEIYYNSLSRATGGVESFALAENIPGNTELTLSMRVVAPDLFKYEEYGKNYLKAGNGLVTLPKVATIVISAPTINARIPVPQFGNGKVTLVDESGQLGSTETNARFSSNVLMVTNQPQL